MVNWCIRNPMEGQDLAADDPSMIAIQAYIAKERRGVALAPGKH
jgi:thiosulfate dehydrogenase